VAGGWYGDTSSVAARKRAAIVARADGAVMGFWLFFVQLTHFHTGSGFLAAAKA